MTADQLASTELRALIAEVRDDLGALGRLAEQVAELARRAAGGATPSSIEVMAAAGYLHHAYTAMESIHERIVTRVDGTAPRGERWHQELLTLVGVELPGVRPAVLGTQTRAQLGRLMRFRHFFRHAYRIDLLWEEVATLLTGFDRVVADYRAEVEAFCQQLEKAADQT